MPTSEFDLIRRFFAEATAARDDVTLGIGDDCALVRVPVGRELAVSMDTLVEGRHFLAGTDPEGLGHKALAVNLSDLAAMGAQPAWVTLSLTLPTADTTWLAAFMRGFSALAGTFNVQLIGGDTTRGPLAITVQAHGFVEPDKALRRSGGRPGDRLLVSGTLGDAALALAGLKQNPTMFDEALLSRLERPMPRVGLGRLLVGHATAAIDISDGLIGDLRHICEASDVGAHVNLAQLPLSDAVREACDNGDWRYPLAGGDDYELLFSVAERDADAVLADCRNAGHAVQEIGRLVDEQGIALVYPDGHKSLEAPDGFDHFRS